MLEHIKKNLFASFIILIPFQDCLLQETKLGFLGMSPAFIPIILLMTICVIEKSTKGKNLKTHKSNIIFLVLILGYMMIVSISYLLIFSYEEYYEFLIYKMLSNFILFVISLFPIIYLHFNKIEKLGRYIIFAFIVNAIGIVMCDILKINIGDLIHSIPNDIYDNRARGFSYESSWLSSVTIILSLLSMHFTGKIFTKILLAIVGTCILLYSSSKGAIVAILASVVIYFMVFSNVKLKVKLLLLFFLVIIQGWLCYVLLSDMFISDLEFSTSFATRGSSILAAVLIVIYNPLGVGFAGFIPMFHMYTKEAIYILESIVQMPLNWSEMLIYLSAVDVKGVVVRSFVPEYASYYGIPFLLMFFWCANWMLKRVRMKSHKVLYFMLLYILISLTTYMGFVGMYQYSLALGVILNECRKEKNIVGTR